jgi:hypothetical protein
VEEDPSLARPANKIAEIENTAIDMLTLDVQKLTGWLCEKLQLKNRCEASLEQSREVVMNFMRVNNVTAMKIDYQQLMLVVTNLMVRIKEREEAADGNREEEADSGMGDQYPTVSNEDNRKVQSCPRM